MLATLPRAAPRAARRLTTATALRAPLAPPYAHSVGVRPALAPPYTHPLAHVPEEQRLKAPYAFSLLREHVQVAPPTREEFMAEILDTAAGREWAQAEWTKVLTDLAEQVSCDGNPRRQASSAKDWREAVSCVPASDSTPPTDRSSDTRLRPLPRYRSRRSLRFLPTPTSARQ